VQKVACGVGAVVLGGGGRRNHKRSALWVTSPSSRIPRVTSHAASVDATISSASSTHRGWRAPSFTELEVAVANSPTLGAYVNRGFMGGTQC
jgi:hypothetical protein